MVRKILAAVSIMVSAAATEAYCAGEAPRLYGTVIYSANDVVDNGVYSFNLTGEPGQSAIPEGKDLEANGGGFFANGRYYFNQEMELYGSVYRYHYVYEFPSWERVSRTSFSNKYDMANDMAYDPMLGCAFGCFPDGTNCYFGSVSIPDFKVVRIGDALPNEYSGIAIDNEGTVYAIDSKGELFTVEKFTGKATSVGQTGLIAEYQSSAVFDNTSKTIYYSVNNEAGSKLYTIDPATANATFVYDFPNDEQVVGIFIPYELNADAPAAVTALAVEPDGGELKAAVSFTMPAATNGGTEISGNIAYEVRVNDEIKASGNAECGSTTKADITVPAKGEYTVTVFAIKDDLRSPVAVVKKYIGPDTPAAVKNAKIEYSDENAGFTVSWDAVSSEGVNGGYVDPAQTTYKVVRYPDEVTVAESASETTLFDAVAVPADGMIQYYYTIAPTYAGETGESAKTNGVSLGMIVPPYEQPFSSADALSGYTIIKGSGFFNNEWVYRSGAVKGPKGSWLITPAMKLQGGYTYDISFEMKSEYGYVEESMSIYLGTAPTADAMTTQVLESASVKSTTFKPFNTTMTAATDGVYYIGFVCDSKSWNSAGVYMKNLTISAGQMSGVESVSTDGAPAIFTREGTICINAQSKTDVGVYDIAGKEIVVMQVDGYAEIPVSTGIYVVRAAGRSAKVMVR